MFGAVLDAGQRLFRKPGTFFLFLALILTADHWVLGPYSYLEWHDLGNSHVPRYMFAAEYFLTHFRTTGWLEAGGGVDLLANGISFQNLFFISFVLLPDWLVIPLLRIVQLFCAGYFMTIVLKRDMHLSPFCAAVGGLIFFLLQDHLHEHYFGIGLIPLILHLAGHPLAKSLKYLILFSFFAGVAQGAGAYIHLTIPFVFPFLFLYSLILSEIGKLKTVLFYTVATAVVCALQFEAVMAMAGEAALSHRQFMQFQSVSFLEGLGNQISRLDLIGGFAIGVLGLFARGWAEKGLLTLFVLSAAAILLASLSGTISAFLGLISPIFSGFSTARFAVVLPFLSAALAACGMQCLRDAAPPARRRIVTIFVVLSIGTGPVLYSGRDLASNVREWFSYGNFIANQNVDRLRALKDQSSVSPFRVVSVFIDGWQEGYPLSSGLETLDGYLNLYNGRFHIFWQSVSGPYFDKVPSKLDSFNSYGNHVALLGHQAEDGAVRLSDTADIELLRLANVAYVLSPRPLADVSLEKVSDNPGQMDWGRMSRLEKISQRLGENWAGRSLFIYKLPTPAPRWFLAGAEAIPSPMALGKALRDRSFEALKERALFLTSDLPRGFEIPHSERPVGVDEQVQMVSYFSDTWTLKVTAAEPRVLIATSNFSKGWSATVNGDPTEIIPVYGAFMAVKVPAGASNVVFEYRPKGLF